LKLTLKQNFWEFNAWLSKNVFNNNVHAKAANSLRIHYSTLHELHPIISARGLRKRCTLPQLGSGLSWESFSLNCIFINKKVVFC